MGNKKEIKSLTKILLFRDLHVVDQGIGLAGIGTICDVGSTGVCQDVKTVLGNALTIAHELGHNLGKFPIYILLRYPLCQYELAN